jgi:hypothetical protein
MGKGLNKYPPVEWSSIWGPLQGPDGQTETFAGPPIRYLIAEPNVKTGELEPVIDSGRDPGPRSLYLCRSVGH